MKFGEGKRQRLLLGYFQLLFCPLPPPMSSLFIAPVMSCQLGTIGEESDSNFHRAMSVSLWFCPRPCALSHVLSVSLYSVLKSSHHRSGHR